LPAIISLLLSNSIYAQESPAIESLNTQKSSSWVHDKYIAFRKAYKYNPEYLKNESNRLKFRLLGTVQTPFFTVHPQSDTEKKIIFDSEPLKYVGADIGWNIFAFGYSFGIDGKNKKKNERFSFNTFTRFFAISAEVFWLNNLSISNLEDFITEEENTHPEKVALDGTYFRSRSAQISFFPNGKKMAYGNTINPVFRQLKSAGTLILALGYSDYDFNTNLQNSEFKDDEWISEIGISKINMYKYELGVGYSYNFVVGRHWVLFLSDMIGISSQRYSYEMLSDDPFSKKTKLGGCNYFRTGACYYNKDYFIGAHVLHELDALDTSHFLFNKNNQIAVVYLGYKFNVDGFNRFVSNIIGTPVK
jgi:hypothetical protein